jgi:hypothetical protein
MPNIYYITLLNRTQTSLLHLSLCALCALCGSLKKILTPFPNLNFPQPTRTHNSLSISANSHSSNVARMTAQITPQFARSQIPQFYTLIPTPSNQYTAIPTDCHRPNSVSMSAQTSIANLSPTSLTLRPLRPLRFIKKNLNSFSKS